MGNFLAIAAIVATGMAVTSVYVVLDAVLHGWVLSILWGWFMVPVFHLPPLTIVPAIGITLTIRILTQKTPRPIVEEKKSRTDAEKKLPPPDVKKMEREIWEETARTFVIPWLAPFITLFCGWVVHLCM